ncbi:AbrB/MazE/SpoVT family DNA-binding domain-containing protein [Nitratifractor sp.]
MTVALKKWGNSLAVRIPKDIVKTLDLQNDSMLEMSVVDGALVIKPQKRNRLEELVARIDEKNLHEEIPVGESIGNEAW